MPTDIIHNRLALSNNNLLLRPRRRDANDGRFAQRVHGFQVVAGAEIGIALEDLELVGEV